MPHATPKNTPAQIRFPLPPDMMLPPDGNWREHHYNDVRVSLLYTPDAVDRQAYIPAVDRAEENILHSIIPEWGSMTSWTETQWRKFDADPYERAGSVIEMRTLLGDFDGAWRLLKEGYYLRGKDPYHDAAYARLERKIAVAEIAAAQTPEDLARGLKLHEREHRQARLYTARERRATSDKSRQTLELKRSQASSTDLWLFPELMRSLGRMVGAEAVLDFGERFDGHHHRYYLAEAYTNIAADAWKRHATPDGGILDRAEQTLRGMPVSRYAGSAALRLAEVHTDFETAAKIAEIARETHPEEFDGFMRAHGLLGEVQRAISDATESE